MFERFTDRARRVIVLAQDQARELGHGRLLTGHLLLGVLAVRAEAIAYQAAGSVPPEAAVGVELDPATVANSIDEPSTASGGHLPFSAAAKTVLEYALREALHRRHSEIDVRHVLLALLREDTGGDTPGLLVDHAVDLVELRRHTEDSLRAHSPRRGP